MARHVLYPLSRWPAASGKGPNMIVQRAVTTTADSFLSREDKEALFARAEKHPRKDYTYIAGIPAYVKRDRYSRDHHVLTICLEGED